MTNLGLPVPPGFTITTEACRAFMVTGDEPDELRVQVTMALRALEDDLGRTLGDRTDPLLVGVRSGAKASMPGMMETVLNVGLNDDSVEGLAEVSRRPAVCLRLLPAAARDVRQDGAAHRRARVRGALDGVKKARGVTGDLDLTVEDLKEIVEAYKAIISEETGQDFPQKPRKQLDMAIVAVFKSWNTKRAKLYRRRERIADDVGTAVNICTMVFGNLGETSGTGVCFTRDPATGKTGAYGDYLSNAQGEDVVAGIRNTLSLDDLADLDPDSHRELLGVMRRLETHYRDLCDIEFTIERGKLWMLQTRVGKRTSAAAFRIATPARRRAAHLPRRGPVPGQGLGPEPADVPAVRRQGPTHRPGDGHGRLARRRRRQGRVRLPHRRRLGRHGRGGRSWCAGRPTRTTWTG